MFVRSWVKFLGFLGVLAAFLSLGAPSVAATTTCTFTTSGTTMKLNADCVTDATILVPDGFTLDGADRTITAVDPPGGHFKGAVVRNGGATANVKKLTVTTAGLGNVCDDAGDRLRGIMFEGASGSISHNRVVNINQGASGCQEGNGIEVRNAPFDGTHPATKAVQISHNKVTNYQKTGIVMNGDVSGSIVKNDVAGAGPVNYIAQNGIQVGFGAIGAVKENKVKGNWYSGDYWTSAGILDYSAAAVIEENHSSGDQVGIYIFGNGNRVEENMVGEGSPSYWGILFWGDGNRAEENKVTCVSVGVDVYGNNNRVEENHIGGKSRSALCEVGILLEKDAGVGTGNVLDDNTFKHVVQTVVDPAPVTPRAAPSRE